MSSTVLTFVSIDRVFVVYNKKYKCFKKNYIERLIFSIFILLGIIDIHYLIFYNLIEVNNDKISDLNINSSTSAIDTDTDNPINTSRFEESNYDNISKPYILLKSIKLNLDYDLYSSNNSEKLRQRIISNINEKEIRLYVCYPSTDSNYVYFLTKIWIWIDSSIYSFLPIGVMIICSCFILFEIKRKCKSFTARITNKINKILAQKRLRRSKQILFMLTSANAFFIICSLPYCIIYHKSNSERTETDFSFSLIIVHILSYSNNSFNFIFYGLFSEKYKQEISVLFCKSHFRRRRNALQRSIAFNERNILSIKNNQSSNDNTTN
jgi:hypothetical protein